MRWISIINCVLLVSLAVAEPNGRKKRDFTFLKNLVQKILYGKNEINIEIAPTSGEEATVASKVKLYELPGYDDVLIKVPVDYGETYPEEIPVNLNALGSTVGTKTSSNTFDALKDVNNLVSSGILNEKHDKTLKGAFGNMFPNNSEESESNEEETNNASENKIREPVNTKGTETFEDIEDLKKPVKLINPYNQEQNGEFPMRAAQNYPGDNEIETIEANSNLPNCDQLRVDSGFLIPANQYKVAPAPEKYPAPSFVNVFYPNLPVENNIQNLLYPQITEKDHQSHHNHPGHHHYSHHKSHHGQIHYHHHHIKPHHHLHTKLNETSPTGNGTILNDEIEGSSPSSLKTEESTTEDPVKYRVQFVSRLTNTETFQGINMGKSIQDTNRSNYTGEKDNATNPIAASYGSKQFLYRNQDNLNMVTFEDQLKTNNHTYTKEPSNNEVTDSKDQVSGVKQNSFSNITADQNNENSLTSTQRIRIEDRLTPERSRKNHVHHHSSRYTPKRPPHHHHHHRHHHAINPHPLHFHIPQTFGLNENSNKVPNEMAPEDIMPDEVPIQSFGDESKTNENTTNDTDVKVVDNYVPPVTDSTDSKEKLEVNENTFPRDKADQSNPLHYPMSTDKGEAGSQDTLLPERLRNVHVSHRSRHPSRRHRHHHLRSHHGHLIGWRHQPKYVLLPSTFDSDALKSIMNANTLYTNKVTKNPVTTEESATALNKLKDNEWKSNETPQITDKLNGNSADIQNMTGGEPMRGKGSNASSADSKSKNRGDIPDE